MLWIVAFLGIGIVNVVAAWARGILMIRRPNKHRAAKREWLPGAIEVAFYLLFWWVQLAFWMLVRINAGTEWVLARIAGGSR